MRTHANAKRCWKISNQRSNAVVAAEAQATRAAAKLEDARELNEAAAAQQTGEQQREDRKMAARDHAHNKGEVELLRARLKVTGDWSEA